MMPAVIITRLKYQLLLKEGKKDHKNALIDLLILISVFLSCTKKGRQVQSLPVVFSCKKGGQS